MNYDILLTIAWVSINVVVVLEILMDLGHIKITMFPQMSVRSALSWANSSKRLSGFLGFYSMSRNQSLEFTSPCGLRRTGPEPPPIISSSSFLVSICRHEKILTIPIPSFLVGSINVVVVVVVDGSSSR